MTLTQMLIRENSPLKLLQDWILVLNRRPKLAISSLLDFPTCLQESKC